MLCLNRITATALGGALFLLTASACAGSDEDDAVDAKGTVAFVSGALRGTEIFVANPNGSELRQLTQQRPRHDWVNGITWSPDGSQIALSGAAKTSAERKSRDRISG